MFSRAFFFKAELCGESERLLTLFTRGKGISLLFASTKRGRSGSFLLYSKYEMVVRAKREGHYRLFEARLLDSFGLRDSLDSLLAAEKLASQLMLFSCQGEELGELYHEFERALGLLGRDERGDSILLSFALKLLKAEGIFQVEPSCSHCRGLLPGELLSL